MSGNNDGYEFTPADELGLLSPEESLDADELDEDEFEEAGYSPLDHR